MAIELPLFQGTECIYLTACGQVDSEDPGILEKLKEKKTRVARYDVESTKAYIRVFTGGTKGRHLHIDCALASYFGKDREPEATENLNEVLDLLNELYGLPIEVGAVGGYELAVDALPERGIIRSLSSEERTADVGIRLTGGRLSVSGAPIEEVQWMLISEKDRVRVFVHGDTSESIDDGYLQRVHEWITKQFELFVKGKTENADA